jgi:hypothetical protein
MNEPLLELHFLWDEGASLSKIHFSSPLLQVARTSVRGRDAGAYKNASTFLWSGAVKALSFFFVKMTEHTRTSELDTRERGTFVLSGSSGSIAATLDYALSKQPRWLLDAFGSDRRGNSILRQVILRSNPERKSGPLVTLALNEKNMPASCVQILVNSELIEGPAKLGELASAIELSLMAEARASRLSRVQGVGVAVLPFPVAVSVKLDEPLLQGLRQELCHALAAIDGLRVISPDIVLAASKKTNNLLTAGTMMGARYIVSG